MAIIFSYISNAAEPASVCVSAGFWDNKTETRNRLLNECLDKLGIMAESFTYECEESGKPYVLADSKKIPVSVSHSGQLIVVAVSRERAVGLDIESRNRKVASRLLARIASSDEERQLDTVQLWTLKEAFLKMTGTGLRVAMNKIRVKKNGRHTFSANCPETKASAQIISFLYRDYRVALALLD